MQNASLTATGSFLEKSLSAIVAYDERQKQIDEKNTLNVAHAGTTFITAYEQLRSVAENIEDNMLTQAAIKRFYHRNIVLTQPWHKLGNELIIELTLAGYLENNKTPITKIDEINTLIETYLSIRQKLSTSNIEQRTYDKWIFELLTVQTEHILNNPIRIHSFTHLAHNFYSEQINYDRIIKTPSGVSPDDYPKMLYVAIHKELIKSNLSNARSGLLNLYRISPNDLDQLIQFNQQFDSYSQHTATVDLTRFIASNGAPLHVIKLSYFESNDDPANRPKLDSPQKTESFIGANVDRIYKITKHSVYQGIVKSIMFLLLARVLIGVLIEIPYDLIVNGSITAMPLIINLVVPIIFLILSVVTYRKPGDVNKESLQRYIRSMLHKEDTQAVISFKYPSQEKKNYAFEIFFGLTFLLAFYLVITRLTALNYNYLEGALFLIFFSTANFLGYRLTRQYNDIELVSTDQGFIAMIRNFIYLPFVFIGKRIVRRSEKFNLVATAMDVIIDLPLKTVARLIRQWLRFIQSKKDEIQ